MPRRYTPSQADVAVFKAIASAPDASANPHVSRWYNHIKSYTAEFDSLPGSSKAGEAFLGADAAPAAAAKAEEDDDEVDLFGSDDEEDDAEAERVKAERIAAYNVKKAGKPKTIAKVSRLSIDPFVLFRSRHVYTIAFGNMMLTFASIVRCHLRGEALG